MYMRLCYQAFKPMAECARQGIKDNGFEDKIVLIPKRSTELTVGQGSATSNVFSSRD